MIQQTCKAIADLVHSSRWQAGQAWKEGGLLTHPQIRKQGNWLLSIACCSCVFWEPVRVTSGSLGIWPQQRGWKFNTSSVRCITSDLKFVFPRMIVAASAPLTSWFTLVCWISWQCFHHYVLCKELWGFSTGNWFWQLQIFARIYILLYRSTTSFSCLASSTAKINVPGEYCMLVLELCPFKFKHGACNKKGTKYTWRRTTVISGL